MISFQPLYNLMKKRGLSFYQLAKMVGVDRTVTYRLKKNPNITLATVNLLCTALQCNISDIIEFVPDEKSENIIQTNKNLIE